MTVARVCLDTPLPHLDHPFEYSIPAELAEAARPGVRVKVSFGARRRRLDGFITALSDTPDFSGRLQPLRSVVSPVPVLTPAVWRLVEEVADRQAGTRADMLRLAVPRRHARTERAWLADHPLDASPGGGPPDASSHPRTLDASPADRAPDRIAHRVELRPRTGCEPLPDGGAVAGWVISAVDAACARCEQGQVLLIVPDFRDFDQVSAALATLHPDTPVCRVDSRAEDAERYAAFLAALDGSARIILGRRSALYAPAAGLAAIILVDDGDPSYAEPHAPYPHARDVALVRQRQSGCDLVLCANSRSTAVQRLIEIGWVEPAAARPAHPRVIPAELIEDAGTWRLPPIAFQALHDGLRDGPVLVQVARATEDLAPGAGLQRTAAELGRAFPGQTIVAAGAANVVETVPASPALVVSTAGAEPRTPGGYRTVVLLDSGAIVSRPSLWAAEQALRNWMNAAALAAPDGAVVLTQVVGRLAAALRQWDPSAFAADELAARRATGLPPATRWFTVSAVPGAVSEALQEAQLPAGAERLETVTIDEDERTTLRVPYALGPACAAALARVLRTWSSRRADARLRVHADDVESL
jgi:primosomal protein N' (replication factor Y)